MNGVRSASMTIVNAIGVLTFLALDLGLAWLLTHWMTWTTALLAVLLLNGARLRWHQNPVKLTKELTP